LTLSPSLFLEGYGAEALERLTQLIAEAKCDDPLSPVTLVVPTTYTGLSLRRSLAKENGLVNVRFMPLARLAEYLGAPSLAEQGKSPLSNTMKLAAVRHFASQMATQEPLGAIAEQPPLHNYLVTTFSELSTLTKDGLTKLESKSPLLKQVLAWYQLYRGLITNYYDREELTDAAANAVTEEKAKSALEDMGFIIFYLVVRFSPTELLLLSNLRQKTTCAVVLGLTGEEEIDAEIQGVAAQLKPIFGKAIVRSPEPDSYDANHILIAPDAYEEIRWILRHICQNAEAGLPFHRMAILYRNTETYASLVKNQLDLAGIPAAGPDPLQLRDTPAGKLLIYMLNVFESDFARETLMHWLAEAPVWTGVNNEFASRERAMWEIVSGKAGIVKGVEQWQERLDSLCRGMDEMMESVKTDEDGEPRSSGYFESRKDAAIRLKSFLEKLVTSPAPPDGNCWKAYAMWAGQLLREFAHPEVWPDEQQQSYERIASMVEELAELDAVEPGGTTLSRFHQMVDDCLRAASGRIGPTGTGVFTASIGAVQGMDFDTIYVLGMVEGAFPPALPEDAFIPDSYREELRDFGFLPLKAARRIEERRLFRAALASGQKRFLSYPRTGTGGQRRGYPSPWLVREARLLHEKTTQVSGVNPDNVESVVVSSTNLEELAYEPWLSVIYSAQHSVESLGDLVSADIHDYDMHTLAHWYTAGGSFEKHFLTINGTINRALQMEQARRGHLFTAWDGNVAVLAGKSQRLGVPQNRYLAPTSLELWAKCPFQYYLKHVLEIPILELPEEIMTISPLDRGHLIHTILERFIRATRERGKEAGYGEPWLEHHQKLLMEITDEEFKKAESLGITGKPLLWSLAQYEMREDLLSFLIQDSKLRSEMGSQPLDVECRFGFDENDRYSPVVLTLPNGRKISFRGIIDRVDSNASGSSLLVLDYKTGSTYAYEDMKDDPLGAGKHLQLPVYALTVRNQLGGKCEIQAAYWFATARGGFEMKAVALTNILEERFREAIGIIASSIEAGIFPSNPGSGGEGHNNCTYCDYRRVCPADPTTVWEMKSQNPELAQYTRLAVVTVGEEETE